MLKPQDLNHHTVLFGQQFSFTNEKTLQAVNQLASECETVQKLKALLNAEEVFYSATNCTFVQP